jgi:hypothetical protein
MYRIGQYGSDSERVGVEQIRLIEGKLGDGLSKEIFDKRLIWSLTEKQQYARELACTNPLVKAGYDRITGSGKPIGIFAAAKRAQKAA